MSALPKTKDVRHARKRADEGAQHAFDVVKNPFFAALGAADAAAKVVTGALNKAGDRAEDAQQRLQKSLNDLQARVNELPREFGELRTRLEPAEMRKVAQAYSDVAQKVYADLIDRGAGVYGELRSQPQVKRALDSVESGVDTAQEQLEVVVRDLNKTVDDLRGRFARTSRSMGEKAARETERAATATAQRVQRSAGDVADAVQQAGRETAASTRSTTRQAANRAAPPRKHTSTPSSASPKRSGDGTSGTKKS